MWLFGSEKESPQRRQRGEDDGRDRDEAADAMSLGRYRSYGRFYERYWTKLFGVTQADMARFVDQMKLSDAAPTLTELAQDVVRARLRQGPQLQSAPASTETTTRPSQGPRHASTEVRRWDPTGVWRVGDRVVTAGPAGEWGRSYAPRLGEIAALHEDRVVVHVDGSRAPQVLALGASAITEGDAAAEAELAALAEQPDEASQVDYVLWEYGQFVAGRLLQALDADERFVELEGRWSLRDLTTRPSDSELDRIAVTMFERDAGPLAMSEVMMHLPGQDDGSFSRRLGLALALRDHSDLFRNVGTDAYPRWTLAGPPSLALTAHHAAYDPDTYAILCVPGETLSRAMTQRLWDLGLLHGVIAPVPEAADTSPTPPNSDVPRGSVAREDTTRMRSSQSRGVRSQQTPASEPTPGRVWPRWLRLSRQ